MFGADTWWRALGQGGALTAAALLLSVWPGLSTAEHRSLVLALLLIAGGGLVWLNGEPRQPITRWGAGIGTGLWLLLLAIPGGTGLLALAPLGADSVGVLIATLAVLALLALSRAG